MNAPYPASALDVFPWHRCAQVIAAYVSARRGLAAHLLFGRPLNCNAQALADRHAQALAYRQKWGLP